mgnify:CR=1 FL=1
MKLAELLVKKGTEGGAFRQGKSFILWEQAPGNGGLITVKRTADLKGCGGPCLRPSWLRGTADSGAGGL